MSAPCTDLVAFADGELDVARASAVRAHLRDCESCGQALVDALATSAQLSTLVRRHPPHLGWWARLLVALSPSLRRIHIRAQFATHYADEASLLRGLIARWCETKDVWDVCPPQQIAQFERAYREHMIAEQALRAVVAPIAAACAEERHRKLTGLLADLPGPLPSADWQERVLADIEDKED